MNRSNEIVNEEPTWKKIIMSLINFGAPVVIMVLAIMVMSLRTKLGIQWPESAVIGLPVFFGGLSLEILKVVFAAKNKEAKRQHVLEMKRIGIKHD